MFEGTRKEELRNKLSGLKVMITGGLGMIGSTIAHGLIELGAMITIVDSCIKSYGANMFNLEGIADRVTVNIADIRDRAAINFLVRDMDIIFNLAGQVSHNHSIGDPFQDADINYMGHLNVLECVKNVNPRAKLLYAGSRLQFGTTRYLPVDEDHPLQPKTPYALNKTAAENMYRYYSEQYGIPCVLLRIANPYGIRCQMKHSKYSIVNYFIRQAMENKKIFIYGNGEQLRDYIYVEDLAEAYIMCSADETPGCLVFNVGSGVGTRFKDMVLTVCEIIGRGKIDYVPWPDNYVNVETGDYYPDISKLIGHLGWEPKTRLDEGIRQTFEFYKEHKNKYF